MYEISEQNPMPWWIDVGQGRIISIAVGIPKEDLDVKMMISVRVQQLVGMKVIRREGDDKRLIIPQSLQCQVDASHASIKGEIIFWLCNRQTCLQQRNAFCKKMVD